MTPNGETYSGLAFQKGSCGVSIIRSGEAMEQGLRDCCRSIRIGKILIQVRNYNLKLEMYNGEFRIQMSLRMKKR